MKALLSEARVRTWLAIMGAASILLLAAYVMAQQSTRHAANDQPLALAQTIKHQLANGAGPTDVIPAVTVDLRDDISPFVTITDSLRNILGSSAKLDGKTPLPPAGVFSYTKAHGEDTISWQPKSAVRLATYITTGKAGNEYVFIITGQSLKPAEDRIGIYNVALIFGWLLILAWTTFILFLPDKPFLSKKQR